MKNFRRCTPVVILAVWLSALRTDADVILLGQTRPPAQARPAAPEQDNAGAPVDSRLAGARNLLMGGAVKKCRDAIDAIREINGDLRHTDVLIAEWLMAVNQYKDATAVMEPLAVKHPDRPDVRLLFADVALQQDRLFDAWVHATAAQAAELPDSWSLEFRRQYSQKIVQRLAMIATRRSDWETALTLYRRVVEDDDSPQHLLELARAEFLSGDVRSAETHIRIACRFESVDAIPELILASLSQQNQQPDECEAWFREGLRLDSPACDRVRLEYVRWLIRGNRAQDAARVLASAEPAREPSADRSYLIGLASRMMGDFAAAENEFAALHQSTPGNYAISNQLALVLIESSDEGKRGRALQIAEANVRRFPGLTEALSTLGWIQFRLGDVKQAEKTLTAAISKGQVSRDTAYYVSKVKAALGNSEEATAFAAACEAGSGEFFNAVINHR